MVAEVQKRGGIAAFIDAMAQIEQKVREHFHLQSDESAKQAKNFLYKEISIVFSIPFENVEDYLHETIEKQLKEF